MESIFKENTNTNIDINTMPIFNNEYQDCIDFLNDCAQACYECFDESLRSSDLGKRGDLLKALIECAQQCEVTVGFLARNSMHVEEMALISAHFAKVCAAECEKFEDEYTKLTAQVCMETAHVCIEYFDD